MTLKEQIESLVLRDGKILASRCTESYLTKLGLWKDISSYLPFDADFHSPTDMVTCIMNDLVDVPTCGACGKFTSINGDSNRKTVFRQYCSRSCAYSKADYKLWSKKVDKKAANDKRKLTMLAKHGVEFNSQRSEVKKIISNNARRQMGGDVRLILEDPEWIYRQYITEKKTSVEIAAELGIYYGTVVEYIKKQGHCIRQYTNVSYGEKTVHAFCETLGESLITSYRGLGKDIDVYWHSSTDGSNYMQHLNKTMLCESNDIQLLHIFEDEWLCPIKSSIWKSIITHKLGLTKNKIFARKCAVVEVSSTEARLFHTENHLHGFVGGVHIGLCYDGKLVMCLTYGKSRFKEGMEILRITTKKEHAVVGGINKLIKRLPQGSYSTYADRRFSNINSYTSSFKYIKSTNPNYWWTDGTVRISRYRAQKQTLLSLIPNSYDATLSEFDNMVGAGYRIIYDSGNHLFELMT